MKFHKFIYRLKLLFDIAIRENCTKLITGDNCTKLAAQILSDMAQGRGAHVALECVRRNYYYFFINDYFLYRIWLIQEMNQWLLSDHFGEVIFIYEIIRILSRIYSEIMAKEIAMYNRLNSIESLQNADISTMVCQLFYTCFYVYFSC